MEKYTVKEIAELLNTEPATVRGWIRDRKLDAEELSSNKEGRQVTAAMLREFLENYPKYTGLATKTVVAELVTGGVAVATSVIAGALCQAYCKKEALLNAKINSNQVIKILETDIKNKQSKIDENKKQISKLQKDNDSLSKEIANMKSSIKKLNNIE